MANASCAESVSPVSEICRAFGIPIRSQSLVMSVLIPKRISGRPKEAPSAATMTSPDSARSKPPAKAGPATATTSGFLKK